MMERLLEEPTYTTEAILLATIPKLTALLSVLGSASILTYILSRRRKGRPIQVYHRIMFSISCSDLVASCNFFVGTFPIPRGTVGAYGPVFWALGTDLSCRICGAWAQLQVLSPLYNGILALYYLLVVQLEWTEPRVRAVEPYLRAFPLVVALVTACIGAGLDVYGSVEWLCWVDQTHHHNWQIIQWVFLFGPVWFCILFVSGVMLALFASMRKLERANQQYNQNTTNHNKSRQIAIQGVLYVGAFLLSWFFPSILRCLELAGHKSRHPFVLQMLDTALLPLQGLFNALIYVRPRYLRLRRQYPHRSTCQLMYATYRNTDASTFRQATTGSTFRTYMAIALTSFTNSFSFLTLRTNSSKPPRPGPEEIVEEGEEEIMEPPPPSPALEMSKMSAMGAMESGSQNNNTDQENDNNNNTGCNDMWV